MYNTLLYNFTCLSLEMMAWQDMAGHGKTDWFMDKKRKSRDQAFTKRAFRTLKEKSKPTLNLLWVY